MSAGDVNGDGFDDVIVGAYFADPNGESLAGRSYVVFGKAGGFAASFDLAGLDGDNGFRLDGVDTDDNSGRSVASAGDVNADGFDDLIIGAPGAATGDSYVVFGKADGFIASFDLAKLDGANGFRLDGLMQGGESGHSVASAGDVDGDGFDDIIIGSPESNGTAGGSSVVFGRAPSEAVERIGSAADQAIRGGAFDDPLSGGGGDDSLFGGGGGDLLRGNGGRDELTGGADSDELHGGGGRDRLLASEGRDILIGGGGGDAFALDDEVAGSERVSIADFTGGEDVIEIDADDFGGGLVAGPLDLNAFRANASGQAEDAEDRFLYDTDSGKLFFDADGTGAGGRVLIAQLFGAPSISASDFIVTGDGGHGAPISSSLARAFGKDADAMPLAMSGGRCDPMDTLMVMA